MTTNSSFPLTDSGNAERFARRHGDKVRYCHPWGKWLVWDEKRWKIDDTGAVNLLVKETVRSIYTEAAGEKDDEKRKKIIAWGRESESAARRKAMLELAKSEPPIPILPEVLDEDPCLLNCLNVTIDLRTGKSREHRQGDYITKLCPVSYDPDAPCDVWDRFLIRILGGNDDLYVFLQRFFGYALTALVIEQILLILYGVGANGKSTLLNAYFDMIGPDYAMKAVPDLLLNKKNENHPTERADLFGKRFVAAIETDDGRRLAESLVKELTGGDYIRARRMREDFWQFKPTHKIVLACNHKPTIRGTDHAIWRRIRLVPFNIIIPDAEQDKQLPEKLRAELPGILAWCVRGCLEWQRQGLGVPPEVADATAGYREDQDFLGSFLQECCMVGPEFKVRAGELYSAYKNYCETSGEFTLSQKRFGAHLTEKGYRKYTSNGVWYEGLGLVLEGTEGCGRVFPYKQLSTFS